jgi:TRAP-type C4-dicarboxylate transport system substrate-binding protein
MNIMKFMEVEKYHTMLNHTVQCNAFLVNEKIWNKLSGDQRLIFKNSLNALVKVYLDMVKTDTEKAQKAAEKLGVHIIQLSHAELQAFKNVVQPVYAKYRSLIGEEFYNYVMTQVEAHKK